MTIQPITPASVALYLTPADLQERGVCPDQLDLERTLEIAREAFQEAGLPLEGSLEIEAYPEKCGVLVFARVRPAQVQVYSFEDWEQLLSAVSCLAEPLPDGTLRQWDGRYWLILPAQEGQAGARLAEFGRLEQSDPYITARLQEYGAPLLEQRAPSVLKARFCP